MNVYLWARLAARAATLPLAVAKDVVLVGTLIAGQPSATARQVERIKRDADDPTI